MRSGFSFTPMHSFDTIGMKVCFPRGECYDDARTSRRAKAVCEGDRGTHGGRLHTASFDYVGKWYSIRNRRHHQHHKETTGQKHEPIHPVHHHDQGKEISPVPRDQRRDPRGWTVVRGGEVGRRVC